MTDQRDLFYPASPGWKATDTSKAAAEGLRPTAANLRDLCLAWVTGTLGGLTPDECAENLGISILSIRPRFSELKRLGKIEDSGERRFNASGHRAIVWKAKP